MIQQGLSLYSMGRNCAPSLFPILRRWFQQREVIPEKGGIQSPKGNSKTVAFSRVHKRLQTETDYTGVVLVAMEPDGTIPVNHYKYYMEVQAGWLGAFSRGDPKFSDVLLGSLPEIIRLSGPSYGYLTKTDSDSANYLLNSQGMSYDRSNASLMDRVGRWQKILTGSDPICKALDVYDINIFKVDLFARAFIEQLPFCMGASCENVGDSHVVVSTESNEAKGGLRGLMSEYGLLA